MLPLTTHRSRNFGVPAIALGFLLLAGSFHVSADPIRVSDAQAKQSIVAKVTPLLPPIAKQAHISGRVLADLTVNEDGTVEKVDIVSGNPILSGAASKAGKGWMFSPFKGPDGKPAKAVVRIAFDF